MKTVELKQINIENYKKFESAEYQLRSSTGEIVLLDCGCNYKKILRGIDYQISNVEAVLLSHEHG